MTSRLAFLDSKKHLRAQIPGALFLATSYSLLYRNTKTSTYKLQLLTFPTNVGEKWRHRPSPSAQGRPRGRPSPCSMRSGGTRAGSPCLCFPARLRAVRPCSQQVRRSALAQSLQLRARRPSSRPPGNNSAVTLSIDGAFSSMSVGGSRASTLMTRRFIAPSKEADVARGMYSARMLRRQSTNLRDPNRSMLSRAYQTLSLGCAGSIRWRLETGTTIYPPRASP
jgi:hypothetical protein